MRAAGQLAADLLCHLGEMVEPGITTQDLDDEAMAFAEKHEVEHAPLGYKGFPRAICTSVNDVVCHGIPEEGAHARRGRHRRHRRHAGPRRISRRQLRDVSRRRRLRHRTEAHPDNRGLFDARESARFAPASASVILAPPSKSTPRPTAFRSCETSSGTGSAGHFTERPRFPTSAAQLRAPLAARHGVHRRADDQRRCLSDERPR